MVHCGGVGEDNEDGKQGLSITVCGCHPNRQGNTPFRTVDLARYERAPEVRGLVWKDEYLDNGGSQKDHRVIFLPARIKRKAFTTAKAGDGHPPVIVAMNHFDGIDLDDADCNDESYESHSDDRDDGAREAIRYTGRFGIDVTAKRCFCLKENASQLAGPTMTLASLKYPTGLTRLVVGMKRSIESTQPRCCCLP